jgi:hypothetical protein
MNIGPSFRSPSPTTSFFATRVWPKRQAQLPRGHGQVPRCATCHPVKPLHGVALRGSLAGKAKRDRRGRLAGVYGCQGWGSRLYRQPPYTRSLTHSLQATPTQLIDLRTLPQPRKVARAVHRTTPPPPSPHATTTSTHKAPCISISLEEMCLLERLDLRFGWGALLSLKCIGIALLGKKLSIQTPFHRCEKNQGYHCAQKITNGSNLQM